MKQIWMKVAFGTPNFIKTTSVKDHWMAAKFKESNFCPPQANRVRRAYVLLSDMNSPSACPILLGKMQIWQKITFKES